MQVTLEGARYPNPASRAAFMQAVMERLQSAPGVGAAGSTTILPLAGGNTSIEVRAQGRAPTPGEAPSANWRMVSPGYFRAIGLPLRRGRPFDEGDRAGAPNVSIISESMARRFWPDVDAVGERFQIGGSTTDYEVVGVVADIRDLELEQEPTSVLYLPYAQGGWAWNSIVVRASGGDPMALVPTVRAAVRGVDRRAAAIANLRAMEELVDRSLGERRFTMIVLGVFAALALALASIGVYGVMAFAVAQRTHEIGVRLALGARRADILGMILGQGSRLVLLGLAAGVLLALPLARTMGSLLYGVSPFDPTAFAGIALVLAAVAAFACWLPARRATRVDPMLALRHE